MDFMHKQLINAASKDALSQIGMGAGIGAGVGAANALITGNDSLLGGATSGAMLGAGAGGAMRYAGAKYGSGLMAAKAGGEEIGTGLQTTMFTKAHKDATPMSFMGKETDKADMAGFAEAAGQKAAAKADAVPEAGAVSSASANPNKLPPGTNMAERQNTQKQMDAAFRPKPGVDGKHHEAQSTWDAKLASAKATSAAKAARTERNAPMKAAGVRDKAREQSADRRQQRMFEGQVADSLRAVDGDMSRMGNSPYTAGEIAAGFKKTGKSVDQWADHAMKKRGEIANEQAQLSAFRTQTMRDHLVDQGARKPGLSNSAGPATSLDDMFKYMNGV